MSDLLQRATVRWQGYDYANVGAYYLTICTQDRSHLFGQVKDGVMHPSPIGDLAQQCWDAIPEHMSMVVCDAFVVMPNHVHGIIVITDVAAVDSLGGDGAVGAANSPPLRIPATNDTGEPPPPNGTDIPRRPPIAIMVPNSLGHIMQTFKAAPGPRTGVTAGRARWVDATWYTDLATRVLRTHHPRRGRT